MIIPIKHRVGWELISQQKQTQIDRDNARDNKHRVYYDYKVRDKFMITYHTAYKYETPYKGPFVKTQCFNNDTVNLQCIATEIRHNICFINPYESETKVEDFNMINMNDDVNI